MCIRDSYNSGQCGTSWCKTSSYEESSARPFVSLNTVVLVCCDWPVPWLTHQTALLHNGGDDAATLRNCPEAITLLLAWLFHENSGLILVDLEKKVPEQQKIPMQNTPWPYPGVVQRYEHARVPVRCKLTTAAASSRKKQWQFVVILRVQALLLLLSDTYRVCEYLVPGTSFHTDTYLCPEL